MIVVGVDGSVAARAAVAWAANDAFRTHQPLRLVHAVDRQPYQIPRFPEPGVPDPLLTTGKKALDEAVALVRERQPGVEVVALLEEGPPATILREQAGSATELVMGSRGLGPVAGALLGSVSDQVAGHADAPVVVVQARRRPVYGRVVVGVDDAPECLPALGYAFEQATLRGAELLVVHAGRDDRAEREAMVRRLLEPYTRRYSDVAVTGDVRPAAPAEALTAASEEADLLVVGSRGRRGVTSALLGSVSRGVLHHARCTVAVVRAA